MGIAGIVINSPLGVKKHQKAIELISKLLERKKKLEQIKATV
jgi:hypothetical protein